ncbi:MAG: hypothetical protein M3Y34_06445 [Actinomycetota bacterium]|nr:hypothetical protein [Actinomycetota bacterium]
MRLEDLTGSRGRLRGRMGALAAAIALISGLAACGEGEPAQTTAAAETGASETGETTTATEPGAMPDGGEEGGDPAADEAAIVATIEAVLAGKNPAKACGESVTERFLRRSYGDAAGCEAAQAGARPAADAGVTQVVITPQSVAQALARPKGGIYDGQKLRAELVLEEDVWKLDSLRSNVPVGP